MCRLLISTAAEVILLVVKTAAAFAPVGQTISPKSSPPDFLMSHLIPAAKNPRGPVIVLFVIRILLNLDRSTVSYFSVLIGHLKPDHLFKNMLYPRIVILFHFIDFVACVWEDITANRKIVR